MYNTVARHYHRLGYSPLPIPRDAKYPPPSGFTGAGAPAASIADVEAWCEDAGEYNVALRLPPGVLGIDVDAYSGKAGADTLAAWAPLGMPVLPWSTSRPDDPTSGIRLCRVPEGLRLTTPGPGIDLIHYGHRYVVAAPSTVQGRVYHWRVPLVPAADLPELPAHLLAPLIQPERGGSTTPGSDLTAGDPAAADGMAAHYRVKVAAGGSRHDAMQAALCWAWREANAGLTPWDSALGILLSAWESTAVADADRQTDAREFDGMVTWAQRNALSGPLAPSAASRAVRLGSTPPGPQEAAQGRTEPFGRVRLTPASQIPMRSTKWLWEGRVPLAHLTLLAGKEGIGKSQVTSWLAAQVSRGTLPGNFLGTPRGVLMACTEDDWSATLAPRLAAAGADMDRVYRVEVTEHGFLSLPADIDGLSAAAGSVDAGLLILDPLLSRLGADLDSHKDAEVRVALEPTVAMATAASLAVVGIIHLNKGGSSDPLNSVMASKAFTAVARSVLMVAKDADEPGRRVLAVAKSNLGRDDLPMLGFGIEGVELQPLGDRISTSRAVWSGEVAGDLSQILDAERGNVEERTERAEAVEWLREWLTVHGEVSSSSVKAAARAEGHGERSMTRARGALGVLVHSTATVPRTTTWQLPPVATRAGGRAADAATGEPACG